MSAGTVVAPRGLREAEANTRWLSDHPEVARRHHGHWLCIVDQRLVVAEADWKVFAEKIQSYADRDGRYIVRIPASEELEAVHPRL
jgi:hypothetical protein